MLSPSVAIIVLNYRGERVLSRCLASLELAIGPADHVLVADNGHEDTLLSTLRSRFPWIETISTESNRGFAAGMNLGIQRQIGQRQYDAYWLLNNDASITPDTLNQLKQALREKGGHAVFSPVIYQEHTGTPWYAGGRIDYFRMRTVHERSLSSAHDPYETDFLTGCALFVPREVIASIGLLDERYFLYYEDAAYSLRARRAGFRLWVVPQATVYHSEESRSNPAKTYWLVRSGAEFFLRESRGWRRGWVRVVYALRRLKNQLEIWCYPSPMAHEVKRAYTDVSL
ncbi:MAG: glycosyltransferase family 2 protein [Candidatus Moraniibacteriota bacterium]